MLKPVALGAILLSAGLTQTLTADEIRIEGASLSRDIHCTSSDVGILGAGNAITLTGRCRTVLIYGANHTVTFEGAEKLVVSGSANKVTGGTSEHLLVEVANNDIQSTLKPGADGPSTLEVTGSKNAVSVSLEGQAVIQVAGADHKVTWTAGAGVAPPKVEMSGMKNSVKRGK